MANVVLSTPEPSAPFAVFAEFSLKLVMNMVTTGANTVSHGSVLGPILHVLPMLIIFLLASTGVADERPCVWQQDD